MFEPQVAASCQSVSIWPIITKSYRLSKIWTLGECMIIQYITYIYIYLQVIKYFFGGSWTECNQEQSCDQASIVCVAFFDCRILERCSAMYMVTWSTVKLPCLRDSLVVTCVDKNHWQGWYWLHTQFGGTLLDQLVLFVCEMFFDVFCGWLQGLVVGNDSKQFSVRFWPQPKEVEGPYSECPTPGHGSVVVDWDMTNPATAENVFKLWNQRYSGFLDVQYHPVIFFSALEFWNWNLGRKKPHNDVQWSELNRAMCYFDDSSWGVILRFRALLITQNQIIYIYITPKEPLWTAISFLSLAFHPGCAGKSQGKLSKDGTWIAGLDDWGSLGSHSRNEK